MNPLFARYPFLSDARAAVEAADIDLVDVVTTRRSPIVDRALERIEGAIHVGRVPDPLSDSRVELLSYPVARVLVSLVNDPALTERYALAEARRAFDLLASDMDAEQELRSSRGIRLQREDLLADFGVAEAIQSTDNGFIVAVMPYLSLASAMRDRKWRLINRRLAGGWVPVTKTEGDELIREMIRERVGEGLPLDVPEIIATELNAEVAEIEGTLANVLIPDDVDRVIPAAFPPCLDNLVTSLSEEGDLTRIERFTAIAFLAAIGLDEDELVAFLGATGSVEERLRREWHSIHGGTSSTAYPPPSCATLETAGVCVDQPDECDTIGHPVVAYAKRVQEYTDVPDWREDRSPESA